MPTIIIPPKLKEDNFVAVPRKEYEEFEQWRKVMYSFKIFTPTATQKRDLQRAREVYKELERIPLSDQNRVLAAIEQLPLNPLAGDIEKMKGEQNSWRRRVGAYRIFYELDAKEKIIHVFRIERRTSNTY